MSEIDHDLFCGLKDKYQKLAPNENYTKYLNKEYYLKKNLKRAYRTGLHKTTKLDILDLGAGAGYFCLVCNHFGHEAMALDVGECAIFDEVIHFLCLKRCLGKIEPFKKLPRFAKKYDLITAFYVPFNKGSDPVNVWRIKEWRFFLNDIVDNVLKINGQIFFCLHPEKNGKHYDKSLLDYFLEKNATVCGQEVYFKKYLR